MTNYYYYLRIGATRTLRTTCLRKDCVKKLDERRFSRVVAILELNITELSNAPTAASPQRDIVCSLICAQK